MWMCAFMRTRENNIASKLLLSEKFMNEIIKSTLFSGLLGLFLSACLYIFHCRCPRTIWCLFLYARVKKFIHFNSLLPPCVCVCLCVYCLWEQFCLTTDFSFHMVLLFAVFASQKSSKDLMCVRRLAWSEHHAKHMVGSCCGWFCWYIAIVRCDVAKVACLWRRLRQMHCLRNTPHTFSMPFIHTHSIVQLCFHINSQSICIPTAYGASKAHTHTLARRESTFKIAQRWTGISFYQRSPSLSALALHMAHGTTVRMFERSCECACVCVYSMCTRSTQIVHILFNIPSCVSSLVIFVT